MQQKSIKAKKSSKKKNIFLRILVNKIEIKELQKRIEIQENIKINIRVLE